MQSQILFKNIQEQFLRLFGVNKNINEMNVEMLKKKTIKMLSLTGLLSLITIALFVIFNLFVFSMPPEDEVKQDDDDDYYKQMSKNYVIYNPKMPDEINFAGERMPIENFDVYQALDYEIMKIMFWHSEMILYLKRQAGIFKVVEPILKENGVPDDFKYLMVAESGMVNVVSPAKAEGYWQFLKGTAQQYGLEVNSEVDERYHLEKSTVAACKYLQDSYRTFGSWSLAAASYNVGSGRLKTEIERQKMTSFYDLKLYTETSRYLYRIVVYKLMMTNPRDFGFYIRDVDSYKTPDTKVIEVNSSIPSLIDFAIQYGTNYKVLKQLNPWLRSDKLTNSAGKTYFIHVPNENGRAVYFKR